MLAFTVLETSAAWKASIAEPTGEWTTASFDDSAFAAAAQFGTHSLDGADVSRIWAAGVPAPPDAWLRGTLELDGRPATALLDAFADDDMELFVNGVRFVNDANRSPTTVTNIDVTSALVAGTNVIAARVTNVGGDRGFAARLEVDLERADAGDTLATALPLTLSTATLVHAATIGDGAYNASDVDLFRMSLVTGTKLTAEVFARRLTPASAIDSYLRVFNEAGQQITYNDDAAGSNDSRISQFTIPSTATYFIGVSDYSNSGYDPTTTTGRSSSRTGPYELRLTVILPDTTAPTAAFATVASPRTTPVESIAVTTSETVTGLTIDDFSLTRDGESVSLTGVVLTGSGSSYTLSQLGTATASAGTYVLTLVASGSGISDSAGNLLAGNASVSWDSSPTNLPPSGLFVSPIFSSLPPTPAAGLPATLIVANIIFNDDGVGTNTITLSGDDAAEFELITGDDGSVSLAFKAGVVLDPAVQAAKSVTVTVQDLALSDAPLSDAFTIEISSDPVRLAFGYGYGDLVYPPPAVVGRAISEMPVRVIGAADPDTISLADFVLERDWAVIPWAADPTAEFPQEPTLFISGPNGSIGSIAHLTAERGEYTIRFTGGATDINGTPLAEASFSWNHTEPVAFASGANGWAMLLEAVSDTYGLTVSEQVVDAAGVIVVAGSFSGAVDFDPRPDIEAIVAPDGQGEAGFIARYDSTGSLLGVWQIGGAIEQVAVANGRLAIAGTFDGAGVDLDPRPDVAALFGTDGEESGFLVTLDSITGAPLTTTIIAVTAADGWDDSNWYGYGIWLSDLLLADDGRAFVSGSLRSASIAIPAMGGATVSLGVPLDASDGFVAAIDATGAARWATRFDGDSAIYYPATAGSMALAGDVLALGVARSGPLGILPGDPETVEGAVVIGLTAATGGYRWHATVVEGANDSDTVFVAATPDGRVHATGAVWVGDIASGSVVANLITVMAATGSAVGSVRSVGDLIGAAGDVYVAGLLPRADGATLLFAKDYGAAGDASSLHMINLAPWLEGVDPAVETWSTPQEGWTGAVSLTADGRVVFLTGVYENDLFPIGQDGGSERLVTPSGSSTAIWSIADPFATVVDPAITVPAGETQTDTTVHTGDEQLVKRGAGTLVLDLANTHSGGTVVEEGLVVVRNVAALGTGTLDVRAGATVRLEVGFGTVALPRLALAAGAILDLGEAKLTIGPGGADEATIRQWIVAGRNGGAWNGTSGIRSRSAAAASGSRTVGYVVRPDGSATVVFTSIGDLDLDRDVDVFDLLAMSTGGRYGQSAAATWTQGDVNYDGRAAVFDLVGINTGGRYGRGSIATAAAATAAVNTTTDSATAAVSPTARTSAFAQLATGIAWEALADGVEEEGSASSKKRIS